MKYIEIHKPHLKLGCEGEYAGSEYDQGGGLPALRGARLAYDRLDKIEAPEGWTATSSWFTSGEVCLTLRSPSVSLGREESARYVWDCFGCQVVFLEVTREGVRQVNSLSPQERSGSEVRVGGQTFTARYSKYCTLVR
jgi:hypothetical protein